MKFAHILAFLFCLGKLPLLAQVDIAVQAPAFAHQTLYFGALQGNEQSLIDSLLLDADGNGAIQRPASLPQGVYLLAASNGALLEFLLTQQQSMRVQCTDTAWSEARLLQHAENELMQYYFQQHDSLLWRLQDQDYQYSISVPEEQADWLGSIASTQLAIQHLRDSVAQHTECSLLNNLLRAQSPIQLPEALADSANNEQRQSYLQEHFFDNVAFEDERLLRSSVFAQRLHLFFEKLLHPHPDTAVVHALRLVRSLAPWPAFQQAAVEHLLLVQRRSERIGMDKTFVAVVDSFIQPGHATWMSPLKREILVQQAERLRPSLIGAPAPAWELSSVQQKPVKLADIRARYLLLIFWSPDCSHCREAMPALHELYHDYREKGLEVAAILTNQNVQAWRDYIRTQHLSWINLYDPDGKQQLIDRYNLEMTPSIFLLDQEKKILLKQLSSESIYLLLNDLLGEN